MLENVACHSGEAALLWHNGSVSIIAWMYANNIQRTYTAEATIVLSSPVMDGPAGLVRFTPMYEAELNRYCVIANGTVFNGEIKKLVEVEAGYKFVAKAMRGSSGICLSAMGYDADKTDELCKACARAFINLVEREYPPRGTTH